MQRKVPKKAEGDAAESGEKKKASTKKPKRKSDTEGESSVPAKQRKVSLSKKEKVIEKKDEIVDDESTLEEGEVVSEVQAV